MTCQVFRGLIFPLLLATTVVACQTTGYRVVGPRTVDASYSVSIFSMRMEGYDNQTCTAAIHTAFYDETGFLGICGFILNTGEIGCGDGYLGRKLTDAVFENATLLFGETVISKAGFYTLREFGTTADDAVPTCVRTEFPWREIYTHAKPTFKYSAFTQVSE